MVRSFALASLLLAACNTAGERAGSGECPAGEVCSPATPSGLHFIGTPTADQIFLDGPGPTAIGGTQEISLEYDRANSEGLPLDLPYRADDDGGAGVRVVSQSAATVTVQGAGSRSNYLRIVDAETDELFDRYELTGAAVTEVALIGTELEKVPAGMELVWGPGDQTVGVALRGDVQQPGGPEKMRLVDTSLELALPGSTRAGWDLLRLSTATAGTSTISVTTGGTDLALPLTIVAGADAIEVQTDQDYVPPGGSLLVCFTPKNQGRYVYGLTWRFNLDGVATTQGKDALARNCINVDAPSDAGGTTIAVVAAAGGAQANVSLTVGFPALVAAPAPTEERAPRPTAGDRARR